MKSVYIFSAGKRGRDLLALLKRLEIADVIAFIDNNIEKQGTMIDGKRCISVEDAAEEGGKNEWIIVAMANYEEPEQQLKKYGFRHVFCWAKMLPSPSYCFPVPLEPSDYNNVCPFNNYESPYPDLKEIHRKERDLFDNKKDVLDIDFNVSGQLSLLKRMETLEVPQWSDKNTGEYRYNYENRWFEKGSAHALCYMIQIVKPKKIIEIGSGYSTAVMLDTNENYFDNKIKIISVEPRCARLKSLLKPTDNLNIVESDIQEIPVKFFEELKENDILFVDSSHVSKIGSDVNYIFFEILPRLNKGVYIHFHDMKYPFIYPKEWIYEGRAYNEMYLVRAFLMNNTDYSVQLFGSMWDEEHYEKIADKLRGVGTGSLWIKKEK